jgi:hypothetical protein
MLNFWTTLFDENDSTCFSTNAYGTGIIRVDSLIFKNSFNFFSINPMRISRKDDNVTKFRNFLLECDELDLAKQKELLKSIPYSTLVYSGGKSIHAIISLENPLNTKEEYNAVAKALLKKVPEADPSTKNPSRFSRVPGAMRGGVEQKLLEVKERIPNKAFFEWLGPLSIEELVSEQPIYHQSINMSPWTRFYLFAGAQEGQRNSSLFKAACDLFRCGYSVEEVENMTYEISDLPLSEVRATIKSAYRKVNII